MDCHTETQFTIEYFEHMPYKNIQRCDINVYIVEYWRDGEVFIIEN